MSDKKETLVSKIGKIASLKEIITGLLVIISLIGGLYGSLKPEVEARENKATLAPVVEDTNKLSQENADLIKAQAEQLEAYEQQLRILNEKFEIIELINVSLLKDRKEYVIDLDDLYKLFEQKRNRKQKKSPKPDIKIDLKPRAKTYWE